MRYIATYIIVSVAGILMLSPDVFAQQPVVAQQAASSADALQQPVALPQEEQTAEKATFDSFGISLFYDDLAIKRLKTALEIAKIVPTKNNTPEQKEDLSFLEVVQPTPQLIELTEYPVFHMASLVSYGAGKWVMWLNGKRVTSKTLPEGLSVVSTGADYATFRWQPNIYSALSLRWKDIQKDESQQAPKRIRSFRNTVKNDPENRAVTFSLRSNQTYVSAFNNIVEGKVNPTPVADASGKVDVNLFEQVMRDAESNESEPTPRVVAPDSDDAKAVEATVVAVPKKEKKRQAAPRVTLPRLQSSKQKPSPKVIGVQPPADQVPEIFPGGVPATPAESGVPEGAAGENAPVDDSASPDLGLPILPQ